MKTYSLNVFGSEYKIKTDRNGDYVLTIGKIVDDKMKMINREYPQGSLAKTAIVSCINLVDDFLTVKQTEQEKLNRRLGLLIEKLERIV
ncbi:MAG: cell division protein ZapA [Candidatus Latescibacteria bacterium]|nr:cell division protein ZapA [Candidatus Latescibacterota bacterium]